MIIIIITSGDNHNNDDHPCGRSKGRFVSIYWTESKFNYMRNTLQNATIIQYYTRNTIQMLHLLATDPREIYTVHCVPRPVRPSCAAKILSFLCLPWFQWHFHWFQWSKGKQGIVLFGSSGPQACTSVIVKVTNGRKLTVNLFYAIQMLHLYNIIQ